MDDDLEQPSGSIRRRGAVAVVLREERFLVICRSAHVVAPGAFCFPGGGIEGNESEAAAVVREFQEELGAAVRPVRKLWRSITVWGTHLAWWLGEIDAGAQLNPNPAEVESVCWLTREEMLAHPRLLESNREFLQAIGDGAILL